MNTIKAVEGRSKFVLGTHLVIEVDGEPLDQVLAKQALNEKLVGLVPTIVNWLEDPREQEEVWSRFSKRDNGVILIPILCCPDDVDFACTIIMVRAEFKDDHVIWSQFGYDVSEFHQLPSGVGSNIELIKGIGQFIFDKKEYEVMALRFEETRNDQEDNKSRHPTPDPL